MKTVNSFIKCSLFLLSMISFLGCEPDEQGPEDFYDRDDFTVSLSADRSIGEGQYSRKLESGDQVNITVGVQSASPLTGLMITKTVNLKTDSTFGNNGTVHVDATGTAMEYNFSYTSDTADIDQLVGFTFEATNAVGQTEVSDLTLVVTLSPRDNLPRRRWALTSILHVNNENQEVIKECEKDNSLLLNADSTMVLDYGENTAAGECAFDGFKVYTKWYLSEDEKTFVREYYDLFDPGQVIKQEVFEVKTLTTEQLGLELTVDLTVLGLGIETFLYTYTAVPR